MANPVFYDPKKRRWPRLRILFDFLGIAITGLVLFFVVSVFFRLEQLPRLLMPEQKRTLRALKEREHKKKTKAKGTHRKTQAPASEVVLNADEGIRAAYYVTWDAASFVSLQEYYPQVDILFPEWLHVLTPDGNLQGVDAVNQFFPVIQNGLVHSVDDKVMPFLKAEKANVDVFPLINNFDAVQRSWLKNIGEFLNNPAARQNFRSQLLKFLASDRFKGAALDFEEIPKEAQPGFRALVTELSQALHERGMKLYLNVPVADDDYDYGQLAANSDGLVIMNYDQHQTTSDPGPVASQDWFLSNLQQAVKDIDRSKIICGIGSYGYDWAVSHKAKHSVLSVDTNNVQEAWLHARESESAIIFDPDSLNPHFAYVEDNGVEHQVWYLDAVTALNEMRSARQVGIRTFALWRLGSEDRSLWAIWDNPNEANAEQKLKNVPAGQDVDREGYGEVLYVEHQPAPGERQVTIDPATRLVISETMPKLPEPYQIKQYGARARQVAITFDDGPDPAYTPKILDILKQEHASATFFLIGMEVQKYPGLAQRIYQEGHAIGNHTFTHPDISDLSRGYMAIELNLTERLFASKLGVKPLYFRPPYSIDQEPDVAEQVRPLEVVQEMGYITVGSKIDPNDWQRGRTADQIVAGVIEQAEREATAGCEARPPLFCGSIILLHDGGGDRAATVRALPAIIDGLRSRGFQIVSVEDLLGKTRAEVMPKLAANEIWAARVDDAAFRLFAALLTFISLAFILGDILMSARLLGIGALATYDRLRNSKLPQAPADFQPAVTVIIPAFNEEKVIERTVRSVLASDYPKLRIIVVDDGSKDATSEIVRAAFAGEIAKGRILLLTKSNAGKATALNVGLQHTEDEVYVGIDADTTIAPSAVSRLVGHFADPEVGAVAGNAKVGNRVNLWTRWQALEYITSQNFERRALNVLGAVSVVPGAIGAWRRSAVREAGGYHTDTVAEDADLTMSLLERGWKVVNEDRALAFTEAPTTARGLMRQRFRWSFGILQAVWKHGSAIRRRSRLGWIALPNIIIFQILLPLVSPFIDLFFLLGSIDYLVRRHFHPESTDPSSFERLVVFFVIFLLIDFIASSLAFFLERRESGQSENWTLLLHLWLQRFAYRQLFSAVLFRTVKRAIDGKPFAWDKLERTAVVSEMHALRGES
jgi:cellulose synthase/poly-beta-1,6-N-acetylglucosamine synthase-like glycosyltransferase/peptidoglycan/xylan/chitin deacetylase (PgdA/CDA1 family)/spore germination protein YaaH